MHSIDVFLTPDALCLDPWYAVPFGGAEDGESGRSKKVTCNMLG